MHRVIHHNILIVGDGDLTFSLSLASALGGTNLVATTFDIRRELYKKYEGVKTTIQQIEKAGGTVVHSKLFKINLVLLNAKHVQLVRYPITKTQLVKKHHILL